MEPAQSAARPGRTILGLPLPLYLLALALTLACTLLGCLPANMVGALVLLMVVGEGFNALGNTLPVVRTYLGGSVLCIFGGAALALTGLVPPLAAEAVNAFVNREGFLILYISALITGSLFKIHRSLLLRASVRLLPVAVAALAVGCLVCGLLGMLLGGGFWDSILYIAVAMTSGGMTAGTVPLSTVYASTLGVSAADVLTRMAPATVLGNCIAIVFAGLLNNLGKKRPALTGNGRLVNDGRPVKPPPATPVTLAKLCTGMAVSLCFYILGALFHGFIDLIPIYAWMIALVLVVKCTGCLPENIEDAVRHWGDFAIHSWTAAALFGIGLTLIDLAAMAAGMTVGFLIIVLAVELSIMLTAALLGRAAGFFPIEAAITGMCATNMGGSGNVAVLAGARRMELLPFAQIVTRTCGALMLTLGGVLVRLFG